MRIVGFSSTDDPYSDGNDIITECPPELLAEYIVEPALTNRKRCRLEFVVLNTCNSLPFAQVRRYIMVCMLCIDGVY
jgi:hypothetical protein